MHETVDCKSLGRPVFDSYESYGCKVNAIGVDELFSRYEAAGFLYPGKMQRLSPFLPIVKENWRRGFRGGELLHWIVTYDDPASGAWGSVSSWRSTGTGWNTQHLVSMGSPIASRAVMLSGQAVRLRDGLDSSHQNWFRRSNRFANKIFGSIPEAIGTDNAWVGDHAYFTFDLSRCQLHHNIATAARFSDLDDIRELARVARSPVFAAAEGLDGDDITLQTVDELYRRVKLRRYRQVFLLRSADRRDLIGCALAYRGPLGLNFSFLENRCDLILSPRLSLAAAEAAYRSLLGAAAPVYADFEPKFIPVVANASHAAILGSIGGEFVREYAQSIWLAAGYESWYRHTERFYSRLIEHRRRSAASPLAVTNA